MVKLVNGVLARAADEGASDIHFEPQAKELLIRFRHDGVLHEIMTIPKRLQAGVISRLKIMADLDIAERRIPQDGRIGLIGGGQPDRHAGGFSSDGLRREDRHPSAGSVQRDAASRGTGLLRRGSDPLQTIVHEALRGHAGHRAHRLGQVDHALRARSTSSTRPRRTSSPSRTRSSTGWPASTRCRSTPRPG